MQNVRIKEDAFIAKIAAWKLGTSRVALVLGKTIYLHNTTKDQFLSNSRWVKHELAHIRQFEQYGFIRFLTLYMVEYLKNGYYNNRFEVEARRTEDRG